MAAYWAVDPENKVIYTWDSDTFTVYGAGETARFSGLPGIRLDVKALLTEPE